MRSSQCRKGGGDGVFRAPFPPAAKPTRTAITQRGVVGTPLPHLGKPRSSRSTSAGPRFRGGRQEGLAFQTLFPTVSDAVIGILRLVGLINAAVWFGAAVFFVFGAGPLATGEPMRALLGPRNFPYFGTSIYQLIAAKYYILHLICSCVALLHMGTEWVYLGKNPRRFWVGLALALTLLGFVEQFALQPHLQQLHRTSFSGRAKPEQREAARRVRVVWQVISRSFQFLMVGGLAVYLWRTANPPDLARFVPAAKFRS